jgi:hypothetical protein
MEFLCAGLNELQRITIAMSTGAAKRYCLTVVFMLQIVLGFKIKLVAFAGDWMVYAGISEGA